MANADDMLNVAAERAQELAVPDMSSRPSRKVAVLACMDVRLDLYAMLGLERGEAHILRNAGGLVTDDVIRSISASQRLLGTDEVVVIMHEHCGLNGGSDDEFSEALAADGARPSWKLGAFAELDSTLRAGLERLRTSPELSARDRIHGFVFDPETGALRDVESD